MLPANFRIACAGIPSLRQAFANTFSSCASSDKCSCGTDVAAGTCCDCDCDDCDCRLRLATGVDFGLFSR